MLPQEVAKSLENIRSAFLELSTCIEESENSEEIWERLMLHYPFQKCFNELTTEVCAWVEEHTGGPYVYVIMTSGTKCPSVFMRKERRTEEVILKTFPAAEEEKAEKYMFDVAEKYNLSIANKKSE